MSDQATRRPGVGRRRFMQGAAAAIAGGAQVPQLLWSAMVERELGVSPAAAAVDPATALTPVDKMFIYSERGTPDGPALSKESGALTIDGAVATPLELSYADLAGMPHETHLLTLECWVNGPGGSLIGTLNWEGIPLPALMRRAGVKDGVRSARIEAKDGRPFRLPMSELGQDRTLLVSRMNGQPTPMVYGGVYGKILPPLAGGNHIPKWVKRITFSEDEAGAHPAPVNAGFLEPKPNVARVSQGPVRLHGYGFSGSGRITDIEISTDAGRSYQPLPFPRQDDPAVWTLWEVEWTPPRAGFYVLRVRGKDEAGREQSTPGTVFVEVV